MGIKRLSNPQRPRHCAAILALACALTGLALTPGSFAQQAPAPTTDLGTLIVTPTPATVPTLAPARTTAQRGALELRKQSSLPPPSSSPAIPAETRLPTIQAQAPAQPGSRLPARTPAEPLRIVVPKYPPAAIAQGLRGSVTVAFTIEPDGSTANVHIVASEPAGTFDAATLQAVRQWRFEPATANGRPLAIAATQTVVFTPPLHRRQAPVPPPPPVPVQAAVSRPPAKPAPVKVEVRPVHRVAPRYPPRAYRQGIGGSVTLRFIVGTDGKPHRIQIVAAKPPEIFDRAAKQALRQWRFKPVKTPTEVTQTIRFTPPGQ